MRSRIRMYGLPWLLTGWLTLMTATSVWAEESVRLGFLIGAIWHQMSRAEQRAAMEAWAQELGRKFQLSIKVYFYDDLERMRRDFQRMKINMVATDALSMARTFRPAELAQGFSAKVQGGWELNLLTTADGAIHEVADLTGKSLVLRKNDTIARLYLENLCLRHFQRECRHVFREVKHAPSDAQSIMRVYFGKADVALAYRKSFELVREMNPRLGKKVGRVVAKWPLASWFYAFYNAKVDPAFHQRALRIIPVMHTYPRGRQLLDLFRIDRLEFAQPSELAPLIELDRGYRELKARAGGKVMRK